MGRTFWSGALERLIPEVVRLPAVLESLEARNFVRRDPASRFEGQDQFRFKHSLIRDVAYAALPRAQRRDAHTTIAAFLEEFGAEHDSPAVLGQHWLEAGDSERAAEYFTAAADQASRGWAKEEAAALYRQAIKLIGDGDPARRRELRLKLAVAQQMVYHVTEAQSIVRRRESDPDV
jgi:predicted ATPase